MALGIQKKIELKIKRDWEFNDDIRNEVAQEIDDYIFDFSCKKSIVIDVSDVDNIIEGIIQMYYKINI